MAIVLFDDMEHGTTLRYSATLLTNFATSVPGMFGRCLSMLSGSDFSRSFRYDFGTVLSQGMVSFALSTQELPNASTRIFSALNGTTHQVTLYLNSNGSFSVARNTTILGTTPIVYTASGIRYRIELGFEISDASGTYALRINGTEHLNATSHDTRNGVDGFDRILFGSPAVASGLNYFDDILLDDDKTQFWGDFYGQVIAPTSDASGYSTPSTGVNRWATIDETPYSATDYNTFPGTGEDVFGMADLSDTPTNIYGVCVNWVARKTDTGTCDMRSKVYSGSANATMANQSLNVASVFYQQVVQNDPNTSAAWSASAVNALTVGTERTA